jgi:hypothetical protein
MNALACMRLIRLSPVTDITHGCRLAAIKTMQAREHPMERPCRRVVQTRMQARANAVPRSGGRHAGTASMGGTPESTRLAAGPAALVPPSKKSRRAPVHPPRPPGPLPRRCGHEPRHGLSRPRSPRQYRWPQLPASAPAGRGSRSRHRRNTTMQYGRWGLEWPNPTVRSPGSQASRSPSSPAAPRMPPATGGRQPPSLIEPARPPRRLPEAARQLNRQNLSMSAW